VQALVVWGANIYFFPYFLLNKFKFKFCYVYISYFYIIFIVLVYCIICEDNRF
jgi:hypothetical protein